MLHAEPGKQTMLGRRPHPWPCSHLIPAMRGHLPAPHHGRMGPGLARYTIRINGHLGATLPSAFPALASRRHGGHTVLTGLLDQSALSASWLRSRRSAWS
jgi:hypothetical protein